MEIRTRKKGSSVEVPRALARGVAVGIGTLILILGLAGETSRIGGYQLSSGPVLPGGPWLAVGILVVLILLCAAFVAAETAVSLLRPMHVKHLREKNPKQGDRLQSMLDQQADVVAVCNLAGAFFRLLLILPAMSLAPGVAAFLAPWMKWEASSYLAVIVSGFLLLVLPIAPLTLMFEHGLRSYAAVHPHGASFRLRGLIGFARIAFSLPAKLTTAFGRLITQRVVSVTPPLANVAEEEIKNLVETAEETGEIEEDERDLLHSVFEFSDTVAREVMTPRVDLDAAPVTAAAPEVIELVRKSGHSRIPLFEGTDDQIVGFIHAKDLFMAVLERQEVSLRPLMRPILFVPENKNLHELLTEMRQARTEMAIVQDEFGGTAGIVTTEDIVEELVGDIVDEYDVEEPELVLLDGGWSVDGRMHLDDLNDEIETEFSSEEFDTVGGFVFGHFGRQPKPGESMVIDGYRFDITKTDGRRVQRLTLTRVAVPADEEALLEN